MNARDTRRSDPSPWIKTFGESRIGGNRVVLNPHADPAVPATLGRAEVTHPVPGGGCRTASVLCDVRADHESGVILSIGEVSISIDAHESVLVEGRPQREVRFAPEALAPGTHRRLQADLEGGEVSFRVDGEEVFRHRPGRVRPCCRIGLAAWSRAEFRNLEIAFGDFAPLGRAPALAPAPTENFAVSCAVDFLDDMRRCAWSEEMIARYMRRLREMGVARVYWEDVHYLRNDFLTDPEVRELAERDLRREPEGVWLTMRRGWDEFAVATREAHEAGLEMYALLKPFDWHYFDPANEKGNWNRAQQFLFANRDKIMTRRPRPPECAPDDAPIGAIRLISMNDAPFAFRREDVELWVSDDNQTYRRYSGPVEITESVEPRVFADWWTREREPARPVRLIAIAGLHLTAPHLALRCTGRNRSLRNRLHLLVEIESVDGRPLEFTFGVESAGAEQPAGDSISLAFRWDFNRGVPSARRAGRDVIEDYHVIDGPRDWLGVTRGAMRETRRNWVALSPAYPEVRDFFLWTVRHALDCGADGVDIRAPSAHQRCLSWALRNFNPPMIEAYRQRYGVDPSMEDYDPARFCALAGDFYDLFVEAASDLCRRRGKRIQHHIFADHDVTPDERGPMNIQVHWRRWLEEGRLDAVTLKEVNADTPFFHEVMRLAAERGVETHYCRFLNAVMRSTWRNASAPKHDAWRCVLRDTVRCARRGGCDGIILYEGAAFVAGRPDGRVEHIFEGVGDVLRSGLDDCC